MRAFMLRASDRPSHEALAGVQGLSKSAKVGTRKLCCQKTKSVATKEFWVSQAAPRKLTARLGAHRLRPRKLLTRLRYLVACSFLPESQDHQAWFERRCMAVCSFHLAA